jgi:hypothetical protein
MVWFWMMGAWICDAVVCPTVCDNDLAVELVTFVRAGTFGRTLETFLRIELILLVAVLTTVFGATEVTV